MQRSVISRDGTAIVFDQIGRGPGVILLHGSMETAASHSQLADELARDFTVFLPDRRGRGRSGPAGEGYSLQTEVNDIDALLRETGADALFGVSSGAIIALEAGLRLPELRRIAVYDPPLSINGSVSVDWAPEFERMLVEGDRLEALVIATAGTQLFGAGMPRWLLRLMVRLLARDMLTLVPTFRNDLALVLETRDRWQRFAGLQSNVLLLGGAKSPAYFRTALGVLAECIPNARRMEFARLNHGGSGNRNRGGKPALVGAELRRFFRGETENPPAVESAVAA